MLGGAYKTPTRGINGGYMRVRGTADTYGVQRIHTGYSGYIRGTADTYGVQRIQTGYSVQQAGISAGGRVAGGYYQQADGYQVAPAPAGRHTAGPAGRTTYNGRL